jgi:hypothetical protein
VACDLSPTFHPTTLPHSSVLAVEIISHVMVIQLFDLNGAAKTASTKHISAIMVH